MQEYFLFYLRNKKYLNMINTNHLLISEILSTLESGIDVRQGINVEPGKFDKKNKYRALNKRRAWKIWQE
jgi:hypothetical protein